MTANFDSAFLTEMPRDVAEKIAYRNAEALLGGFNMAKFGAH